MRFLQDFFIYLVNFICKVGADILNPTDWKD